MSLEISWEAVIVTVPEPCAVTKPDEETLSTLELLLEKDNGARATGLFVDTINSNGAVNAFKSGMFWNERLVVICLGTKGNELSLDTELPEGKPS